MSSRCVSVAMVLVGAWLSQAWAQAPGEAQPSGSRTFLWESFEAGQAWSADAGVGTVRSEEHPSEGLYALKVSFHKPTDSCELRRDTRLDLTQMEALSLDTYGDLTRASVALVIETAQGGRFRSPARSIERGWNRDVRFDLTTGDFNQAAGTAGVKLTGHDVVVRMGFVFQPDPAAQSGMLYLDNVRFIGAPTRAWQRAGPTVNSVTAERTQVPQYDRFELRVDLSATVSNWFDPDELNLVASILTPSGRRLDMPGFLAGYRQQGLEPPEPVWLIRFSPDELGLYRYSVSVTTELGRAVSPERTFTCVANPGVPGFVRVSPRDRRYFQTDDGRFFYPIGQNVAWSVDYESYFRKMHDAGENWVRVWICPWNCWLERKGSLGRYDLAAAARLDDILALADKYDLYVQLVLVWHGLQDQAWQDNPYNQANGGPCRFAGDFYTDPRARMFFQRTLRYIVARYGWSRRIFAWELFNEVDRTITPRTSSTGTGRCRPTCTPSTCTGTWSPARASAARWSASCGSCRTSASPTRTCIGGRICRRRWPSWPSTPPSCPSPGSWESSRLSPTRTSSA